jgi:hypothetical protein
LEITPQWRHIETKAITNLFNNPRIRVQTCDDRSRVTGYHLEKDERERCDNDEYGDRLQEK